MSIKNLNYLIRILSKQPYYTKQNLALALGRENYSLDYWIKKLIRENILIQLKKGFYISSFFLEENNKKGSLDEYFFLLANILREPSYISLERVLSLAGLIPEQSFAITSITIKSTRIYKTKTATFIYRSIKPSLFIGYKKTEKGIYLASPSKSLFDFLYLKKFKDNNDAVDYLTERGRINWGILTKDDKKEFDRYVDLSKSKKMTELLAILTREKLI